MLFFRIFLALTLCFTSLSNTVNGVVPGDTFTPDTFPIIKAAPKPLRCVRIASFNIRCADVNGVQIKDRADLVLKQICDIAPDSVGMQEVTGDWLKQIRRIPGYETVGEGRDGRGSEGCQILYNKLRYTCLETKTFWLSETPDEMSFGWDAACRRICTYAVLKNRLTGDVYAHVNTHFDHRGKVAVVKEAQMVSALIEEKFGEIPVVFTADLNATPESEPYRIMTERLADARLIAARAESFGTFHGLSPQTHADYYIDFVLCRADTEVLNYRTVTAGESGMFVSDHFPIYADLRFA